MARASMAQLIADIRDDVGDAAGTAQVFTDDQIQRYLDRNRTYLNGYPLFFERELSGGTARYYRGQLRAEGAYEGGTTGVPGTIVDGFGSAVTGWTLDPDGWVTFAADQAGSARYFKGWTYDRFEACAAVCEAWASKLKLEFDFVTDAQDFKRSQQYQHLIEMAEKFRATGPPKVVTVSRGDDLPLGRQFEGLSWRDRVRGVR